MAAFFTTVSPCSLAEARLSEHNYSLYMGSTLNALHVSTSKTFHFLRWTICKVERDLTRNQQWYGNDEANDTIIRLEVRMTKALTDRERLGSLERWGELCPPTKVSGVQRPLDFEASHKLNLPLKPVWVVPELVVNARENILSLPISQCRDGLS